MSSIMTNASAMTALQSLSATNKALNTTQGRISTGYRVAEASDNAAYWSIATTMRSDNKALSTVQDALGLGAGKVDTAYTAMNKALTVVEEIKLKLVAAVGASEADKAKIDTEIKARQEQLKSIAGGATFSGANWLAVDTKDHATPGKHDGASIVSSFDRASNGTVTLGKITIDVQPIKLFDTGFADANNDGVLDAGEEFDAVDMGILDGLRLGTSGKRDNAATAATAGTVAATDGYSVTTLKVTGSNDIQIQQMLNVVEKALSEMTDAATILGAAKTRIDLQKDFVSKLMDSIDRGVGQLVDADMDRESTRLQALQVQQQLGIQALSIANSNSQNILSLFKG
ncbi:flagellin N-terminal helical domain-containing protein [Aminobacter sp. HY435]|uniref:flagellin N-terminal helical domain-containing protein n=1 Tax=Aminobacter sp. HY435 TaxID=2970917 RepID=UPI0022B9CE48|nr:flagellin [Aminobacter sp. HY435]